MPHEPYAARRIGHSAVPHARLPRSASSRGKFLLPALVVGSMVPILGLYFVSLRLRDSFNRPPDFPRWTALSGVVERTKPIGEQAGRLKDAFVALAEARRTQAEAAELLKRKIDAGKNPATATPETP